MRLIDADKLTHLLGQEYSQTKYSGRKRIVISLVKEIARLIIAQPTIDPVKHGHWIEWEEYTDCPFWCKCSKCGRLGLFDDRDVMEKSDYCPHCGAKMDEATE